MERRMIKMNFSSITFLLTTFFIGLKLGGGIDWSWWWVFLPLWLPLALLLSAWCFIWFCEWILIRRSRHYFNGLYNGWNI